MYACVCMCLRDGVGELSVIITILTMIGHHTYPYIGGLYTKKDVEFSSDSTTTITVNFVAFSLLNPFLVFFKKYLPWFFLILRSHIKVFCIFWVRISWRMPWRVRHDLATKQKQQSRNGMSYSISSHCPLSLKFHFKCYFKHNFSSTEIYVNQSNITLLDI